MKPLQWLKLVSFPFDSVTGKIRIDLSLPPGAIYTNGFKIGNALQPFKN